MSLRRALDFRSRQRSLFAVLKAYSVYNPMVGYVQGMAQITSTLLMYIDDEEVDVLLPLLLLLCLD